MSRKKSKSSKNSQASSGVDNFGAAELARNAAIEDSKDEKFSRVTNID